jgi:hypothetical protein
MAIADTPRTRPGARPMEVGLLLAGIGALLLFISLFLDWYKPGLDAWTVFEVWDLVLAVLAVATIVAVAARMGFGPPRPGSWLIGPSVAALVIVLFAILNHPPAASGPGNDADTGLWLALVAAVLMAAGTALSVARISVALNVSDPVATREPVAPVDPVGRREPVAARDPLAPRDPIAPVDPRAPRDPAAPVDPVASPPPATGPTRRLP